MAEAKKPVPKPTSITAKFWEHAREEVFALPYCLDCGTYTYYPRSVCMRCMSRHLEWRPVSGRGTVYSFDIVRSPATGWEDEVPYVIAAIDLEEGARMMANILTDKLDTLRIGMPVKVTFVPAGPDLKMPQVVPA